MLSLIHRDLLIAVRHSRWLLLLLVLLPPFIALAVFSGPSPDPVPESASGPGRAYGVCCTAEPPAQLFPDLNQIHVTNEEELEALLRSGTIRFAIQPVDAELQILTLDNQLQPELTNRVRYEVVTAQGVKPVSWRTLHSAAGTDLALSLWAIGTIICLVPLFFAQILMSDELESGRFEELMATPATPAKIIVNKVVSLGFVSLTSSALVLLSTAASILCIVVGLIVQDVDKLAELTTAAAAITGGSAGARAEFTVLQILLLTLWHSSIWKIFLVQLVLSIQAAAFVVTMNLIVTTSSVVRKVLEKSFVLVLWLPAILSLMSPATETWSEAIPIFGAYSLISQVTQGQQVDLWLFTVGNALCLAMVLGLALLTIRYRKDWPHH